MRRIVIAKKKITITKKARSMTMKEISVAVFALILTTSTSFAGGCSKHNDVNLEAMSCQVGYNWDDEAKECVQAPQA